MATLRSVTQYDFLLVSALESVILFSDGDARHCALKMDIAKRSWCDRASGRI
jgi:hypothetical protein